jgi:DNA-binding LacI/PurR family transcriptional regulator
MTVYCGGGGHVDNADFARLLRHVRQHRVAGLIFAHPLIWYRDTPVLTEPGIARVAMYSATPSPGVVMVRLARETLVSKGMAELVAKGRRRLAIICSAADSINKSLVESWLQQAKAAGLTLGLHWIQGVSLEAPGSAANVARLLMHAAPEQRPDAIMITDDNLVESATAGLLATGVRVPEDLHIVAHCNFPWPTPSVVPSTRIGFNNTDVLRRCVDLIDQICRGETPPPLTEIAAVREDEVLEPAPS